MMMQHFLGVIVYLHKRIGKLHLTQLSFLETLKEDLDNCIGSN